MEQRLSFEIYSDQIDFSCKHKRDGKYKVTTVLELWCKERATYKKLYNEKTLIIYNEHDEPCHYGEISTSEYISEDKINAIIEFFMLFYVNYGELFDEHGYRFNCYYDRVGKCDHKDKIYSILDEFYGKCLNMMETPDEFLPTLLGLIDEHTPLIKNARK